MKKLLFKQNKTLTITLSALFLALGVLLPMAFHSLGLGTAFSPMHLPVMLCGLICGGGLGGIVGFVTPYLSCFINGGMPPLFPTAVAMSIELLTYGLISGMFFALIKNYNQKVKNKKSEGQSSTDDCKNIGAESLNKQDSLSKQKESKGFFAKTAYVWALLIAMLAGRIMYGLVMWLCLASGGGSYSLSVFFASTFVKTWPALVLQVVAIPLIMLTLDKTKVLMQFD